METSASTSQKGSDQEIDLLSLPRRIKNKELELFDVAERFSSACWKVFKKIRHVKTKEVLFGIVCCERCNRCFFHQKKRDGKVIDYGTKNLSDHMRTCKNLERDTHTAVPGSSRSRPLQQPKVTASFRKSNSSISVVDKEKGRRLQAFFVSSCFRPYNIVSFTTDICSDNILHRSYLDVTFFWVETTGADKTIWNLQRSIYACKHFPERKTSENIEAALDNILSEVACFIGLTPQFLAHGNLVKPP